MRLNTEPTVMEDPEFLKREVERFRTAGCQVWMDDFGSGYSSLSVLREFRFDEIKLDMKFLDRLDGAPGSIIESMVLMARALSKLWLEGPLVVE